ncbi:hypothetical protein Plec18170_008597 [Paecilomyces lecythidis]
MEALTLRAVRLSARRPQRLLARRIALARAQLRPARWASTSALVRDSRQGPKRTLATQAGGSAAIPDDQPGKERVVILGSGWGGYTVSRQLSSTQYKPVVISPRSYFVFTPLLTDTAAGNLDFSNIVEPVRDKKSKVDYIQAAARSVDFKRKVVVCEASVVRSGVTESPRTDEHEREWDEGPDTKKGYEQLRKWEEGQIFEVPYDKLVISVGCVSKTFRTPGVRENAMFFKDIGDSKRVKRRVRECFELAVLPTTTPEMREYLLHFAIVGAGPTGTELAAALRDFIYTDMMALYPTLKGVPKLTLYDVAPKVLSMFDESLSRYAMETMTKDGIDIKTSHHVESLRWGPPGTPGPHEMDPKYCLTIKTKEEGEVGVGMCVWVTGNAMNKFISRSLTDVNEFPSSSVTLKEGTVTPEAENTKWHVKKVPRIGALLVDGHFRVQLESEDGKTAILQDVFAIGDNAMPETGAPPATAQATNQEAKWLAARLNNGDLEQSAPFSFRNLGTLAYIGNAKALMQIPHEQVNQHRKGSLLPEGLKGRTAWLVWKFAYLSMSVSWRNKTRIAFRWVVNRLFGRDISRF